MIITDQIKICVFDAFGTLFNLDPSVLQDIDHPQRDAILAYARDKQLSYTWLHSLMDDFRSFAEVSTIALRDGCRKHNVSENLVPAFQPLYFQPTVFDDVLPALVRLKEEGMTTAFLSNGTHDMLQSGIAKNQMSALIDHVFSADDVRIFKPDPKVYDMVLQNGKLKKEEVLFVSSNQWDVAGAFQFGFQVCWLNRGGSFRESLIANQFIFEILSLSYLT